MTTRHPLLNPLLFYGGAGQARGTGHAAPDAPATTMLALLRAVLEEAGIAAADAAAPAQAGTGAAPSPAATPPSGAPPSAAATAAATDESATSRHAVPASGDAFSTTVARVREVLARREAATRGEHLALDKALAGLTSGDVAQSETVILCEQGGRSGGRVYVSNPTAAAVTVHLRVHAVDNEHVDAMFCVEPAELGVAANAIVPARVSVDLSACSQFTGTLQRRLEFMCGEQRLGICWLTLRVLPS